MDDTTEGWKQTAKGLAVLLGQTLDLVERVLSTCAPSLLEKPEVKQLREDARAQVREVIASE